MPFDNITKSFIPRHGGNIEAAAKHFDIPVNEWLDLSTGLNPFAWPVPVLQQTVWQKLPDQVDELESIACDYYKSSYALAVAGSQMAIQLLPKLYQAVLSRQALKQAATVAVLSPSYSEYERSWREAGYAIQYLSSTEIDKNIENIDVVIIVNPNNPTAECFSRKKLLRWRQQLSERNGWLIIDEAFMDMTPQNSMASYSELENLIVLRSFGKFFGLAGIRLGFVLASSDLLAELKKLLGPWAVSAPAIEIAKQALVDSQWQQKTIVHLKTNVERLVKTLKASGLKPTAYTSLFVWLKTEKAFQIYEHFAKQGILLRYFNVEQTSAKHRSTSLRFGLPGLESDWQRLESVLESVKNL